MAPHRAISNLEYSFLSTSSESKFPLASYIAVNVTMIILVDVVKVLVVVTTLPPFAKVDVDDEESEPVVVVVADSSVVDSPLILELSVAATDTVLMYTASPFALYPVTVMISPDS